MKKIIQNNLDFYKKECYNFLVTTTTKHLKQQYMNIYSKIAELPFVSNREVDKNLTINQRYIFNVDGNKVPVSIDRFCEIRENYRYYVSRGENRYTGIHLNLYLNGEKRYFLESISYENDRYLMTILDNEKSEKHICDFENNITHICSEDYVQKMKKYNKKSSSQKNQITPRHFNKKRPDGYQREYNRNYGRAAYAFREHDDINLILSFKEKYPDSDAFADKIAEYNAKQKSQSETPKESTICISAEAQKYIKRLVQFFNNITDETTFSIIFNDYLKNGILKSRVDANEVEKMKNEISEMENEISEMKNEISEKEIKISTMNKVLSLIS